MRKTTTIKAVGFTLTPEIEKAIRAGLGAPYESISQIELAGDRFYATFEGVRGTMRRCWDFETIVSLREDKFCCGIFQIGDFQEEYAPILPFWLKAAECDTVTAGLIVASTARQPKTEEVLGELGFEYSEFRNPNTTNTVRLWEKKINQPRRRS